MLCNSVMETVGHTPLVRLNRMGSSNDVEILVKLESFNPCGSIKDRVALALIEDAEKQGLIEAGATLVEPTSGNTGIGLAFAAAAKGYSLVLTMPERISRHRVALLELLGARVVLTPGSLMKAAVDKAKSLVDEIPGAYMLQQFENPANPEVHRRTTAREILEDTEGKVDVLIAGVGTGGTITGCGEVLREHNPDLHIVAVEPAGAAVLSGRQAGPHQIIGLGAGFVPKVLNRELIDEIFAVTEETAIKNMVELARQEGLSVGISSGAVVGAALHLAARDEMSGKRIVAILPDGGERYVFNPLFAEKLEELSRGE